MKRKATVICSVVLALLALAGCQDFTLYSMLDHFGEGPLGIRPEEATLGVHNAYIFQASGGSPPYTFSADRGAIDPLTGEYLAPAMACLDQVGVQDSQGRSATASIEITATFSIRPITLALGVNSSFTFSAEGGAPPYTFSIEDGSGTVDPATGLYTAPAIFGTEQVRVEDTAGRVALATVNVVAPQALAIEPSSLLLQVSGNWTFTASGGVPPHTFLVHSGGGSIDPSTGVYQAPAGPGAAVLRVTDAVGGSSYATVTVVGDGPLSIGPPAATVAEDETMRFSAAGGNLPHVFSVVSGPGVVIGGTGEYLPDPSRVGETAVVQVTDHTLPVPRTAEATVTIIPAAPADLDADGTYGDSHTIRLTWTDRSSSEDGFQIERKSVGDKEFTQIGVVGPGVTTYINYVSWTRLPYVYRVRAFRGAVHSDWSAEDFAIGDE